MSKKIALVAFNGEIMCFVHALLNALDLHGKGYDVKLIMEGSATKQIAELTDPGKPFANLYLKARDAGLIDCVCEACSSKMGSLDEARQQDLPVCNDMMGHPALARYLEEGYQIITF